MIWFLSAISWFKGLKFTGMKPLIYLIILCISVFAIFEFGKYVANSKYKIKQGQDYRSTRERIDDAISDPRTPDDIRERLRQLGR